MFSRHVSSRHGRSDITRNEEQKFSHEEKNARELAARTSATTVRFPLSTPTYVSRIIYMEMRICIDFTSKPVTEPASVIDCPATWRRSSFLPCRKPEGGPPSLPLACNHRLLSVTVQTSTYVNFSSCVHRSSKRRNDTRSLFPFLFSFFFFRIIVLERGRVRYRSKFSTGKTERREGGWRFGRKWNETRCE